MSDHTPAPWVAKPVGFYRMAITSAADSALIASVLISEPANPDPESSRWNDTIPSLHGAANCALILAAPELLEACREVMKEFAAFKAEHNFNGESSGITMCRTAIAKATGGAS